MSRKVCKMKQGLLLLCCMIAATGCKQAPPAQMETEYEVMTVVPVDRMIQAPTRQPSADAKILIFIPR